MELAISQTSVPNVLESMGARGVVLLIANYQLLIAVL
jgi:hypothetical protein